MKSLPHIISPYSTTLPPHKPQTLIPPLPPPHKSPSPPPRLPLPPPSPSESVFDDYYCNDGRRHRHYPRYSHHPHQCHWFTSKSFLYTHDLDIATAIKTPTTTDAQLAPNDGGDKRRRKDKTMTRQLDGRNDKTLTRQ